MSDDRVKKIEAMDKEIKLQEEQLLSDKSAFYTDTMKRETKLLTDRFNRAREYKDYIIELVSEADKDGGDEVLSRADKLVQRFKETIRVIGRNLRQLGQVNEAINNAIVVIPGFDVFNSDDDYERRKLIEFIKFDLETCEELWEKSDDIIFDLQSMRDEPRA